MSKTPDQIHKRHDPVDTPPMPAMVEPPNQDTSVPPATVTLPELPRSDELPSLSPQRPDSTEHSYPQATVVERLQQPGVTQQETCGHMIV